jgi:hypothetical protein
MLIRITNHCTMGCSHCMIDKSGPDGEHMSLETYEKALELSYLLGARALIISGGEPFDHPDVFKFIALAQARSFITMVTTNGLFALNPEMRRMAVQSGAMVQVTNDPRYYGRNLGLVREIFTENGFAFEDHIRQIFPCRRTEESGITPTRHSPMCFNMRSATRAYDIISAISVLQMQGKLCSPSINVDGSVRAGEADTCFKLGTVDSTEGDLDEAYRTMRCNRCGLMDNLGPKYLAAIGEVAECRERA